MAATANPDRPATPRGQIPAADTPALATLLALSVGVVIVAALSLGQDVLIPITLAILLSFVLAPITRLLERWHVPRAAAVALAVLLALGAISLVGYVIVGQLAALSADVPRYAAAVQRKLAALQDLAMGPLSGVMDGLSRLAPAQPQPGQAAPAAPAPAASGGTTSPLALLGVLTPVLHPLATAGIVLVVTIFILLRREDLRDRVIRLAGATDLHRTTVALDDAAARLSRYLLTQVAVNATFGAIVSAGLFLIGVPSPFLWGVLAGLLRFVPYVGTLIGLGLPLLLAAAVDPGWTIVLWTAALFLVTDIVIAQVVEPLLYGHSTGLSPVSVIVSAIFWSWIWGPVGLILSMPLTLCLVVLGRHVDRLEFLDVALGDRPALTPAESFYQRMLAADPDEALEGAETLLKDRSLTAYYDEVALKGLQLAANDIGRGVLAPERAVGVKDAALSLVGDLADHPDAPTTKPKPSGEAPSPSPAAAEVSLSRAEREVPRTAPPPMPADLPPAWRAPGAVLCIAGRGPLDEPAAAMLAQLLRLRGFGTRVVSYADVARNRITELDAAGAVMACVSYLDISGEPAHLRYLLRRLRTRLPGAPLLVGLWPADAPVLKDRALQRSVGADLYSPSLHEAVTACVAEAEKAAGAASPAEERPKAA
ncbi:AI-2E family transporter [Roseomonas sp. CCTCC AB2023176]|uniref:AI-2E family transporter n=1 Tax=Roseomonas sp. CCTCC AB2023176 TaxID=3342640 RepID=UPI0035E17CB9